MHYFTEAPSQMAARTLKLVANSLIKLANLVEAKVSYVMIIKNHYYCVQPYQFHGGYGIIVL